MDNSNRDIFERPMSPPKRKAKKILIAGKEMPPLLKGGAQALACRGPWPTGRIPREDNYVPSFLLKKRQRKFYEQVRGWITQAGIYFERPLFSSQKERQRKF